MDADIEKSSSSNLDSSLVIPLQSAANLSTPERASSVDNKSIVQENSDNADINNDSVNTQLKGKYNVKY